MCEGDTDSIFVVFPPGDPAALAAGAEPLRGRDRLAHSIACGQAVSRGIRPLLDAPHNLEYEKTFAPLLLFSKKRYVGLLYEDDPDAKPKLKMMGVALKRRDYAPVVKRLYGGAIDTVLKLRDVPRAAAELGAALRALAEGRYELEDLVISKTLRSYYKAPHQIAHWVLARRMYARDPGSAPQPNDRVPYVFVEPPREGALMGERIEHVDYVRACLAADSAGGPTAAGGPKAKAAAKAKGGRAVHVDTRTYIENQIMKPCLQLFALPGALEQLPGFRPHPDLVLPEAPAQEEEAAGADDRDAVAAEEAARYLKQMQKRRERVETLREREAQRLIFAPVLEMPVFRQRDNRCRNQTEIDTFFGRVR